NRRHPRSTLFPYTTLFRSKDHFDASKLTDRAVALQTIYMLEGDEEGFGRLKRQGVKSYAVKGVSVSFEGSGISEEVLLILTSRRDRKSTRLNSSHVKISYA